MKKLISLFVFLIAVYPLSGQSHGITYQAVIIDADAQEIPGFDIAGNYMPDQALTVRFTIENEAGTIEYQEEQSTTTDKFGMITVTIGMGNVTSLSPGVFTAIDWDGTPKNLRVEICLSESAGDFTELSFQTLYFVPYAFHRNITATGTMNIDGASTLNSSLDVTNGSPTNLSGMLTVNSTSALNGQVTISADISGTDDQYNAYPLRVEGSNQGIGIVIDGSRTSSNNFVTFWDANGIQGRIEGQVDADVYNDPQYIYDQAMFAGKTVAQIANTATSIASAIVDPGNAIIEGVNAALLIAEIAEYEIFAFSDLGVSYESGSGDYAEWLPRLYQGENIESGQIVGVYGGKVTKNTEGAEMVMVVSRSPIVLGNMPPDKLTESLCEKVAFMGQVPVRVLGKVNKGDFIVSYKSGSGLGIAVSPDDLTADQMRLIVGRSWTEIPGPGVSLARTVVGVKTNEWIGFIKSGSEKTDTLEKEVAYLRARIKKSEEILSQLIPGYSEAMGSFSHADATKMSGRDVIQKPAVNTTDFHDFIITGRAVTRESILENFTRTEAFLRSQGVDISNHPFYSKMKSDPEYKELVVNTLINANNKSKAPAEGN